MLQQQLHSVARQKDEQQQLEVEIRAQLIAKSEIMEMHDGFDAQIKEHANAAVKLQEQLREIEQKLVRIHELERKREQKDRELDAINLDNEAAWAKEDLLREQNKELATFQSVRCENGSLPSARGRPYSADSNIQKVSAHHMVLHLCGGAKKRKGTYTSHQAQDILFKYIFL